MFKTIKAKLEERNLRKEKDYLNQKRAEVEQKLSKYERLLEDLTKNYIPVRNKCEELIRWKGINIYKLEYVLDVTTLDNNKIDFKVYGIKEDYWDGRIRFLHDGLLFDETIQLNSLEDFRNTEFVSFDATTEYDSIIELITNLEEPEFLTFKVEKLKENLETIEQKINELSYTK